MPLFKSGHNADQPRNTSTSPPPRRGSMFSNRSSPPSSARDSNGGGRGFFGRRSPSSGSDQSDNTSRRSGSRRLSGGGGFFGMGRNHDRSTIRNDPSIIAARQKVTDAEGAEKEADRALMQARNMVQEAKQHVEILEREALEEAQRAKMKQAEAKVVRKSAKGLGRHG